MVSLCRGYTVMSSKSLYLMVILGLIGSNAVAQSDEPIRAGSSQAHLETSGQQNGLLQALQALIKKKSSVGGVVLRGDSYEISPQSQDFGSPLYLEDGMVFKTMPNNKKFHFAWPADQTQHWVLTLNNQRLLVKGGSALIEVDSVSSDSLKGWELMPDDSNKAGMSGFWFVDQDIEPADAKILFDQLRAHKTTNYRGNDAYVQVCSWLYQEKFIEFNSWCH